jgi:hypothetical protein
VELEQPDIVLGLRPGPLAPAVARRALVAVGQPARDVLDLRDAIDVVVCNLVTRACALRPASSEWIALRAWKQPTVIRVEVEAASSELSRRPRGVRWPEADIELIEGVADRWGIERPSRTSTVVWFEIDRVAVQA